MYRKYWIKAKPREYVCSLGKMPGTEGNYRQHRQWSVSIAGWGAPSCDAVRHKCSVMHSDGKLDFTRAKLRAEWYWLSSIAA